MKFKILSLFSITLFLLIGLGNSSLANPVDSIPTDSIQQVKRNRFYGFPVFFYTPETRFGAGGAGIYAFRFPSDSNNARPSRINFGFAVTQERQLLIYFPFQLFPKNGLYNMYGEIGWYRYNFFFFGTGNNQRADFRERYAVDFPRIRINILRRIKPGLYAGIRWWFEDHQLSKFEPGQQLISGVVPGSRGGRVTGPGVVVNYDNRDNVFYPSKGVLLELAAQTFQKSLGSEYVYSRYLIDAATYRRITKTSILAVNAIADINVGEPPFFLMAAMGGTKRMRGFYEGRFRDKQLVLLQTEWRQKIWKRFGAVAFVGAGIVSDKLNHFGIANTRFTYGAGIRFTLDKKELINIRLDYGRGSLNSSGFYLTIGEAF